ncbi:hypothetical protein [Methylobacterium nodulans]|uniref:Uncharacterized protein n=1 Tax=Methylobacterium nodulans (strain LMG 21967 / CNCM I-2342 / ORS 2060) TaxID=460265 RepID=B8IE65_METNO|nr:hypothetical protein [Methylobacterium nodulans]ACL57611.1 hypothetical protein Mnod_2648 [Methylobacterium nodulans ORS 2060]
MTSARFTDLFAAGATRLPYDGGISLFITVRAIRATKADHALRDVVCPHDGARDALARLAEAAITHNPHGRAAVQAEVDDAPDRDGARELLAVADARCRILFSLNRSSQRDAAEQGSETPRDTAPVGSNDLLA